MTASAGIQILLLPEPLTGLFPWGPWLSFYGIIILGSECAHDGRRCPVLIPLCSQHPLLNLTSFLSVDASPSALIACADAAAAQILWFNVIKCTHADSWLLAGIAKVLAFDALSDTLGAHFKDSAAAAANDLVTLPPIISMLRPGEGGFFPGTLPLRLAFERCASTLKPICLQASATLRNGLTGLG
jgi:hypothetical protein